MYALLGKHDESSSVWTSMNLENIWKYFLFEFKDGSWGEVESKPKLIHPTWKIYTQPSFLDKCPQPETNMNLIRFSCIENQIFSCLFLTQDTDWLRARQFTYAFLGEKVVRYVIF